MAAKTKRKRGRPALFADADAFLIGCQKYFDSLRDDDSPPTTSGLTLSLGFTSVRSFYDQAERSEDFSLAIDWCKEKITHWHEKQVAKHPTYSIGWLRRNRPDEWGDQPEVSVESGQVSITINKVYG